GGEGRAGAAGRAAGGPPAGPSGAAEVGGTGAGEAPPERPSSLYERVSFGWFSAFAPRLPRIEQPEPPAHLHPCERITIPRPGRSGRLSATWFPAHTTRDGTQSGLARGAVLLLPPWMQWGRSYFHRRGRIPALRRAGYHVLTVDFPGFGHSGPRAGFYDRDVEAALDHLAARAPGLPVHLWGVSAGGYWSHMVLSRRSGVAGAMFEDVSPHLLEWAGRAQPLLRPAHALFRSIFPKTFRYFDLRRHAPGLQVARAAYTAGGQDPGIPAEQTRELARLAGAELLIVPEAGHLEAIKVAEEEVIALALATFRRAETSEAGASSPGL
ncbi:MAG: alpha/beta hydrolase, partial [Thermoanaerobaculia bacterium]